MDFVETNPQYDYLRDITYKTCIPYIPNITYGKVVKVYDGDTITIATRIPNDTTVYRFTVRLLGIDSPEMKSQYENEKQLAIQSQNALATLIMDKIVRIGTITFEKYGRILANVYCEGINVSDWMIDNGYAVAYNGKTKQIPDAWRSEATKSEATKSEATKSEATKSEATKSEATKSEATRSEATTLTRSEATTLTKSEAKKPEKRAKKN